MANKSSGKVAIVLVLVLAVLGGGLAWFLVQDDGPSEPAPKADADDPNREMTDEERAAYLPQHVKLEGLTLEPDRRKDTNEVVPGLLRFSGTLVNAGPRRLHKAFVKVFPKDDAGEVLGSFVQNAAAKGGPLAPGESRDFSFTLPDKKGFSGQFGHALE